MENDVRQLLQEFQDGYTARDSSRLDAFMDLFGGGDELEVVGTAGVSPGLDEWCRGPQAVRELVEGDWKGWGDLRLDVDGAHIVVYGESAWLASYGTVSMTITRDRSYSGFQHYIDWARAQEGWDDEQKMLHIVRFGASSLTNLHQGEQYVWPIRFTAVAVKDPDRWRFRQMTFSFATTMAPDERLSV
jgi:hypothetical protein